jgi:hypothetical protein
VDPVVSRSELAALIESSTVEIAGEEHRTGHSQEGGGDFARWGRLDGLETFRRYSRPWFLLLGRRRRGRADADELVRYRAGIATGTGVA